jgi:predicted O-methyltransferase YrrM
MIQGLKSYIKSQVPAYLRDSYLDMRVKRQEYRQHKQLIGAYGRYAEFSLPQRRLSELFPGIERTMLELPFKHVDRTDTWEVPLAELLSLAALVRHRNPKQVFEIGTYLGSSTLVMAHNLPADGHITTLDLDPATRSEYLRSLGYGTPPEFVPGQSFIGTPFAERITQVYGTSATFDFSPYYGTMDIVLVDADHTYAFVKADTEIAFKLLRPGGVIVWDDYTWTYRYPECVGVTRCLNELAEIRPISRIANTRFAIYVDAPNR